MGLIGSGILAAAKGFAQDAARPAVGADLALAHTLEESRLTVGELHLGVAAKLARPPTAADNQPPLRLDADLGINRKTAATLTPAPEDFPPLRPASKLRRPTGPSSRPNLSRDEFTLIKSTSLLIVTTTEEGSRTRAGQSGSFAPAPNLVLSRDAFGVRTSAAPDQEAPVRFAQLTPPKRRGGDDEPAPAPEAPVPFEAVIPGSSPGRPGSQNGASTPGGGPKRPEDDLPDLGDPGYKLAPIRWGGTTGSSMVWSQDAANSQSLSQTQNLDMRASSYIYQPWFAQLGGNFGFVMADSKVTSGAGSENSIRKNESTALNYGGDLNLFPVSRFPFQANFSQNNNHATAQDQSIKSSSTRFGARQNYRPETGNDTYAANVERSQLTTVSGNSKVTGAGASYTTTLGDHSLNSSIRYSANGGDVGGQSSQLFGATASHSWVMDEDFNISTSANFSNSQMRILSGGAMALNNSQLWQGNSSFMWIPDPDIPLTVTGGGSLFNVQTDTGIAKNQLLSTNGYATANYRYSPNLGMTGSATLGQNQSKSDNGASTSTVTSNQTASVSYSGDPVKLLDFAYNWNTSGSFSNQTLSGGTTGTQGGQSTSASASHAVSRAFILNPSNSLNVNASQSYGLSKTSTSDLANSTLSHSAGASWRSAYSTTLVGSLSATGSDSVSTGQSDSHFRTFSVTGNGQWQVNRRAGFNASVNAIWTQQITKATSASGASPAPSIGNSPATWSGGGSLSYAHRNPFDITNLMYGATYSFTTSQTNLRVAAGDPDALSWVVSSALMQRLDYMLGRVKFQATGSLATVDGKKNASVYFSMQRAFGDF